MSLAPWRSSLERALHENQSRVDAQYLQLATVRSDGKPANRTLVFRGFRSGTNQLQFVTDRRSQKIEQIEEKAWAEACWYFPESREQFRLAGSLTIVHENSTDTELLQSRQTLWQSLSDATRSQFTWADPGQPRADAAAFQLPPPTALTPLANFCLLLLEPSQVDHLELRGNPQNRWRYTCTNPHMWAIAAINP